MDLDLSFRYNLWINPIFTLIIDKFQNANFEIVLKWAYSRLGDVFYEPKHLYDDLYNEDSCHVIRETAEMAG